MFKQIETQPRATITNDGESKIISPSVTLQSMDGNLAHIWKEGGVYCFGPVTGDVDETIFAGIIETLQYLAVGNHDTGVDELIWLNFDSDVWNLKIKQRMAEIDARDTPGVTF